MCDPAPRIWTFPRGAQVACSGGPNIGRVFGRVDAGASWIARFREKEKRVEATRQHFSLLPAGVINVPDTCSSASSSSSEASSSEDVTEQPPLARGAGAGSGGRDFSELCCYSRTVRFAAHSDTGARQRLGNMCTSV